MNKNIRGKNFIKLLLATGVLAMASNALAVLAGGDSASAVIDGWAAVDSPVRATALVAPGNEADDEVNVSICGTVMTAATSPVRST